MEHTATFEVRIEGVKGGKPLVPADYDIKEIRALLEEVEVLLFPNKRHQRPVISYEMQEGSAFEVPLAGHDAAIACCRAAIGMDQPARTGA